MQVGVDREVDPCAVERLHCGAWAIGRKIQLIRKPREGSLPVADLLGRNGLGIVLRAEHRSLPHRVIRVLHREHFPRGDTALGARHIRLHQVTGQRAHRRAVRGDVVHDECQHVVRIADLEELRGERHLAGDVERGGSHAVTASMISDSATHTGLRSGVTSTAGTITWIGPSAVSG